MLRIPLRPYLILFLLTFILLTGSCRSPQVGEQINVTINADGAATEISVTAGSTVAQALRIGSVDTLDSPLAPRGYRLLARIPRLPSSVVDGLIEHFGSLQKLLAASMEDLQIVEGVGDLRARGVREIK